MKIKTFITVTFLLISVKSFGQWTPVNVSMNSNFVDVQFINDSVGFITGSYGAFLKTTDYGLNWINTNNTGSLYTFRVHFPGDSVGYAIGQNFLYKTTDQGTTWFDLPIINTWDKKNIFFINDSTGFFLASYGFIYKTSDGGMNWSNIQTNCGTIAEEDIYFADQNTGYFGGWYTACASRTTDGGNTWQTLPGNLLHTVIWSIYFPTATTGYMTGYVTAQMKGVQKTTDSGNTWVLQNTPSSSYTSIYCTDTNTCYAVGPNGIIIKTSDGGANWQQQYSGTVQGLRKIYCIDENICYAVGDSGTVLMTVNGGSTGLADNLHGNSSITVFPNPASDQLTINLNSSDFEVEVYNAIGKRITKIKNQNQLDVSNFSGGMYFVKIFDGKYYYCKKIIVEHN